MSPNAEWRHIKIVEQQIPQQNQELIGGMKNALERGESIEKIKKSFASAGYKKSQIDALSEKMPTTTSQTKVPQTPIQQKPIQPPQKKHASKTFIIILVIIGILILAVAGILGFFWDSIF